MKFVVIDEPSAASMEAIMAMFSRHKAVVDAFVARADHQLRQLPARYRYAVSRRLNSSDLRRSLRKCAFSRIMRDAGTMVMFAETPYAHLHICGSPWEGSEYRRGDRVIWTMRYEHP